MANAGFDWEGLDRRSRMRRQGTAQIKSKRLAELPRNREDDLPPEERNRRKLNMVYRTLRLAAQARGRKFPTYARWIEAQTQV